MIRLLIASTLALLCSPSTHASAPPPIIQATQSANGQCLVLIHYKLAAPNAAGDQEVLSTTFQVLTPALLNPNHRVAAPIAVWADPAWTLTLPGGSDRWPMVSDDCNTLLLLHAEAAMPHQPAFDIYRRDRGSARPISSISLDSLWTPREFDPGGKGLVMINDATPFWFSSGSLAFSRDCQSLDYRTQWGDRFRINLNTGAVTRRPAVR